MLWKFTLEYSLHRTLKICQYNEIILFYITLSYSCDFKSDISHSRKKDIVWWKYISRLVAGRYSLRSRSRQICHMYASHFSHITLWRKSLLFPKIPFQSVYLSSTPPRHPAISLVSVPQKRKHGELKKKIVNPRLVEQEMSTHTPWKGSALWVLSVAKFR